MRNTTVDVIRHTRRSVASTRPPTAICPHPPIRIALIEVIYLIGETVSKFEPREMIKLERHEATIVPRNLSWKIIEGKERKEREKKKKNIDSLLFPNLEQRRTTLG